MTHVGIALSSGLLFSKSLFFPCRVSLAPRPSSVAMSTTLFVCTRRSVRFARSVVCSANNRQKFAMSSRTPNTPAPYLATSAFVTLHGDEAADVHGAGRHVSSHDDVAVDRGAASKRLRSSHDSPDNEHTPNNMEQITVATNNTIQARRTSATALMTRCVMVTLAPVDWRFWAMYARALVQSTERQPRMLPGTATATARDPHGVATLTLEVN
jgi:hypothetical protein